MNVGLNASLDFDKWYHSSTVVLTTTWQRHDMYFHFPQLRQIRYVPSTPMNTSNLFWKQGLFHVVDSGCHHAGVDFVFVSPQYPLSSTPLISILHSSSEGVFTAAFRKQAAAPKAAAERKKRTRGAAKAEAKNEPKKRARGKQAGN